MTEQDADAKAAAAAPPWLISADHLGRVAGRDDG